MVDRKPHILVLFFLLIIFIFSAVRTLNEYRWSAWAIGDAQNLVAARHFKDEGFFKHYLLTYYHPGYLGASHGTESEIGYYTHYPPLSAIINGFLMKYILDDFYFLKIIAVLFSVSGLYFFYKIISLVINKNIGLYATIFCGISVTFFEYVDCLSPFFMQYSFVY
ncbi:MAG: hypothetical protein AB1765_10080 [Candidatus Hydrogenedentota bacterium]